MIKKHSNKNTYEDSHGNRWTSAQIEENIREAKAVKVESMLDEYGYTFCEECRRNDCKPIDCSHDISVYDCKKQGRVELAWDIDNITLRGRRCHQKHDKNGINI